MRKKVSLLVVIGLVGLCIGAMVRAQGSDNPAANRAKIVSPAEAKSAASTETPQFVAPSKGPNWGAGRKFDVPRAGSRFMTVSDSKDGGVTTAQHEVAVESDKPAAPKTFTSARSGGSRLEQRLNALRSSTNTLDASAATKASPKTGTPTSAEPQIVTNPTAATAKTTADGSDDEPDSILGKLPSVVTSRKSSRRSVPEPATDQPEPKKATANISPKAADESKDASPLDSFKNPAAKKKTSVAPQGVLLTGKGALLEVQTSGSRTIVVGKETTFLVKVANAGATVANDVTVTVNIPRTVEVINSTASSGTAHFEQGEDPDGQIKWRISQLYGNRHETLTLKVIPRDARQFDLSVNWAFTPGSSMARIEVLEPKLDMSLTGPREVLFGETKVYTIILSNPGTGDAENVVVNLLPMEAGQEPAAMSKIGTIPAGARKTLEIELTAGQAGELTIRSQAFADGGLRAEATEQILVRRAKLDMKVVGPDVKYAGTVAGYRVRVSNDGDATAEGVVAEAILPSGAKYVVGTDGGKLDEARGRVQWDVGTLRPGDVKELDLKCVLTMAGSNRLGIAATGEGDLAASQTFATHVEAMADLKLFVNDPQGPIAVGEDTTYEVRIVNRGTKAAEQIRLIVFFSSGIEPLGVEGGRSEISTGQVEFQPISRIDAGAELIFKITAKAATPGDHVCRTELECRNPETRLANEETTRFYSNEKAAAGVSQEARRPESPTPAAPYGFDSPR